MNLVTLNKLRLAADFGHDDGGGGDDAAERERERELAAVAAVGSFPISVLQFPARASEGTAAR